MIQNHYTMRKLATGLENYPNTTGVSGAYPNKDIKDETGLNDGTPFNKLVYSDMHQLLAKLLRAVGVVANGLPENETNGFQYLLAIMGVAGGHGELILWDRSSSMGAVSGKKSPLIVASSSNAGDISLEDSTVATERDLGVVTVVNKSTTSVDIFPDGASSDTVDGGASYPLAVGDTKKFLLDKANANWIVF
jgi:hypothetical protein